jgi:ribosomal protein S18 acetylase RimI-like enzyme
MSAIQIIPADLALPNHQQAVVDLIDAYSRDPMGDGKPLPDDVKQRLVPGLRAHPTTIIFLAYDGDQPVGIALCFRGFSSFYAKPLINIHDLAVLPGYRGHGIGRKLLGAVATKGRELDCCKLTLETQENNRAAQGLYKSVGFARDVHVEAAGGSIFMTSML